MLALGLGGCQTAGAPDITGSLPRDCMITDVSNGGVKVIAEYPDIPPEFTIILATGNPRQCKLAWRIGCEFGAQFID